MKTMLHLALALAFLFSFLISEAHADNIDLQVSSYTWTPDPVIHGGTVTFTLSVQNNGPATSASSTLTINLPANVTYAGNASGCTPSAGNTVLTCPIGSLAISDTASVIYTATGGTTDVQTTSATIADISNTDTNGANDTLTKLVTSISGADLQFASHTGPATANAGDTISFVLTVSNAGPDPASLFRVTDNLPAAVDFTSVTANGGADWSCTVNAGVPNVVCDYQGAALASGNSATAITIGGRIITTAGTITNGASVASTDGSTGDPNQGNNTAGNVTVTVAAATDLRANKTMASSTTASTSVYLSGESVTLTLSATNLGPRNATGVTVTDNVPAAFTIGALPSGCAAAGQIITCTVSGTLNSGATSSNFVIPLTAPVVGASTGGSNTANIARTSPSAGSNTAATVNYTVTPPFAHLTVSKTKSANPVLANADITNTIVVTNAASSTSAATGTVTVVDSLTDYPNETYVSVAAPWSCADTTAADKKVTCTYTIPVSLAVGAGLPNLVITTRVAGSFTGGSLSNTACTGVGYSSHAPADNGTSCDTKSIVGTQAQADLAIAKVADKASLAATDMTLRYTLTVTNNGPDTAGTVTVTDPVPVYYSGVGATSGSVTVSGGLGAGESCSGIAATVTCTLKNLANGASRTVTIDLNRPFTSGSGNFTNIATVTSPDTVDGNAANNTATVTITPVAAVTDVAVTAFAAALDPVKAGVQEQFTVSIKNLGPNPAAGVEVEIPIDASRVSVVAGSMSITGGSGSCAIGALTKTSWAVGGALANGIRCTGFTLAGDESRQVIYKVIPVYPYPVATYTAEANITTTSYETDATNNYGSKQVTVNNALLDLSVTKQEALGYDPTGTGQNLLYDPVGYGDQIKYRLTLRNNGPSQATKVQVVDTPTPPGGGYTATYISAAFDAANSNYTPTNGISCAAAGGSVTCYLGTAGDHSDSILPANAYVAINIIFTTGGGSAPTGSLTYSNAAVISSPETVAGLDSAILNNSVTETTTVLPKTDLYIGKAVSKAVVDINEPFTYTITLGNKGTSDAAGIRVTDVLPSGFVMTGGTTVTPGAGVTLNTNACTVPAVGAGGTVTCNIGPLPVDATGADITRQVRITIPVKALYVPSGTYAFSFNANIGNTASIAPLPNTSIDPVASNDSNTVNVQVRKNSIAGTVYTDNNLNDTIDAGEGINSVTLVLSGTDGYANTIPALTITTAASGNTGIFLFDNLPPGTYQIVETQPLGYHDRFETVGTAGGVAPANTCDGVTNCASSAAANTITGITLPVLTATAATGYVFQEYGQATVSGFVYYDANNDGSKGGAETGIQSVSLALVGADYTGHAVSQATTTAANGSYSFSAPPSDGTGYTVTETQPVSHLPGKTTAGTVTGTASVAGTVSGGTTGNVIQNIVVKASGTSVNNNFGELLAASIGGAVFIDPNTNAVKDAGEIAGIPSLTITLTGTDDLGAAVNTPVTTGGSGAFSFTALRPGTYTVTQTTSTTGLTHTGAQAGSKGGTISGAARTSGTGVTGAGVNVISAIPIVAGDSATGYNFGESGQGLAGFVYADLNGNGTKDAGEPGIAGVSVTLSGTTTGSISVCAAINPNPCTVTTASDGSYSYTGLPASNGTGYTLTEQLQNTAPLSNYVDGAESVGTLGGSAAVNDVFSGIVLNVGQFGQSYNFGERAATVSGVVYYDANDNGVRDGSDTGIAGVTITLSGLTASGANVCTVLASCVTTSAADGSFTFTGLPASNGAGYTITETQPVDYAERTNTVGNSGGTASVVGGNSVFSGIAVAGGATASGYLFGEKTGTISGFVFLDANNNGVKDGGETAIAGVSVTLAGTTASALDVCTTIASCTTTTAADGSYSFSGLRNANASGYAITEQAQTIAPLNAYLDGMLVTGSNCGACTTVATSPNSIQAIPLDASKSFTGFNFAELPGAVISGRVYFDTNNNATYDAGEELAGVTLTLSGNDDLAAAVNAVTTSAADGSYSFTKLRPSGAAGYNLSETQPNGVGDYAGAAGTQAGTISGVATGTAALNAVSNIVLPLGGSGINYNFRENASSLAGFVYLDANNNGLKDAGEAGIAAITITLTGLDANGAAVSRTKATGADGGYQFSGLTSGTYTLTETQPASYNDGLEMAGSAGGNVDNSAFDATAAHNRISAITLPVATAATSYNFGELEPPVTTGTISGTVYVDSNLNNKPDTGEPGIDGVTLKLTGTDNKGVAVNLSTATLVNGSYQFANLQPSNAVGYTITETQPAGYLDGATTVTVGNPGTAATAKPVAAGGTDAITGVVLVAGGSLANYNFGEQSLGNTLSGYVYLDKNNNGMMEAGEPGIPGVGVTLTGTDIKGMAVNVGTVTGADGSYSFIKLQPSDGAGYVITETQPANYNDGKTTLATGNPGVITPGKPVASGKADSIGGVVLAAGKTLTNYNFGEVPATNTIAGFVYIDANNNGAMDSGEAGIAGTTVKLTGTDSMGAAVSLSTSSAADGSFSFLNLQPSNSAGYTISETQPARFTDGKTTVSSGTPGKASTVKPVGVGNNDVISGVNLTVGAKLTGYLFGEVSVPFLKPPIVNGYVWLDRNHSRTRPVDGSQEGLPGWTIQLKQNGKLICTTTTDATGFYQFDNLHCPGYEASGLPTSTGFSIIFSRNGTNLPSVPISGGDRGQVPATGGQITGITLNADDEVIEQNLPLDPSGVVYDSVTRKPVPGAKVTISGPPGFDPASQLVGGLAAGAQIVGDDGLYQFLLQSGFPTGVYTLTVVAPAGYLPAPSTSLPACAGAATVGLIPTPALVQASDTAPSVSVAPQRNPSACVGMVPGGAATTQYYFNFHITNGGSAPVLNNHIPLDPVPVGTILITKTTPLVHAARGDLVPYTITATNNQTTPYSNIEIRDQMPPGFKYRIGSAVLNGVATEPVISGRLLGWPNQSFAPQEKKTYKLILVVGAGVGDGDYVNQAWANSYTTKTTISNVASATVRIVPDATFDCPDVIGKVFDDRNANGYQDQGEPGIPGVRLVTPRGLLVTTDADGRFHVPCPDIPNADRGANFVMKLDDRTLPSGYRLTTENPRDVRITRGKVVKLNFGATVHRVVRLELADAAFESGSEQLLPEWRKHIELLLVQLRLKPSLVRIAYQRGTEATELAAKRVAALRDELRRRWEARKDEYALVIETEDAK